MQNGGVIADDCSKCMCPQGYSGLDCGSGVSVTPLAGCAGAAAEVKATWAFGAGTQFTSFSSTKVRALLAFVVLRLLALLSYCWGEVHVGRSAQVLYLLY